MGRRTKKNYMQDGTFAELMEAAKQALDYECGSREGYRVMQVERFKLHTDFPPASQHPREAKQGPAVNVRTQPTDSNLAFW
jgi:hypothetical protein